MSLVNYRRLPVSIDALNRVQPNAPRTPRRLPRPPRNSPRGDDEDYGNDDSMPYPRARNQSALRTSDLVTGLNTREGTPYSESRSSAYQTPSFQLPSAEDLQSSLSRLKSSREPNSAQKESNKRPNRSVDVRVPSSDVLEARRANLRTPPRANLEESPNNARAVNTLSQVEAPTFFSRSNRAASREEPPLTPLYRQPSSGQPKVTFKKGDNYTASVEGKQILDDNNKPISDTSWRLLTPAQKEAFINRALNLGGSGKKRRGRGKKNYEHIQEQPLTYDSERNDLWA